MRTATRPQGRRIRWTAAERQAVIDRGIELSRGPAHLSWIQLLNRAQQALPADRRRPGRIHFSHGDYGWFVAGLGGTALAAEPPRRADPGPALAIEPERPPLATPKTIRLDAAALAAAHELSRRWGARRRPLTFSAVVRRCIAGAWQAEARAKGGGS